MKQKFDVFVWDEAKTNEKIAHPKGQLRLRTSAPCALYIEAQGVEALAGYAADFDLEVSEAVTFRIEAPKGVRAFKYAPLATSFESQGEVFTNIDRMPHESGMLAEVTKARRMLEIERRSMLAEIRKEASIARASLRENAAPAPQNPAQGDEPVSATQDSEES